MYCKDCGKQISRNAPTCPECGAVYTKTTKRAGNAAVLSFFVPGLGQLYTGRMVEFGFFFFGFFILSLFTMLELSAGNLGGLVGMLMVIAIWIWGISDAYKHV